MSRRPTIDRTRISRVAAVLLAAATIGASSTVNAQSSEAPAERAAREIQDARDRANAAAQAMFDKESEVDQLELDIAETEKQLAAVEARANEMRDGLEAQAVRQFVGAGGPGGGVRLPWAKERGSVPGPRSRAERVRARRQRDAGTRSDAIGGCGIMAVVGWLV